MRMVSKAQQIIAGVDVNGEAFPAMRKIIAKVFGVAEKVWGESITRNFIRSWNKAIMLSII